MILILKALSLNFRYAALSSCCCSLVASFPCCDFCLLLWWPASVARGHKYCCDTLLHLSITNLLFAATLTLLTPVAASLLLWGYVVDFTFTSPTLELLADEFTLAFSSPLLEATVCVPVTLEPSKLLENRSKSVRTLEAASSNSVDVWSLPVDVEASVLVAGAPSSVFDICSESELI